MGTDFVRPVVDGDKLQLSSCNNRPAAFPGWISLKMTKPWFCSFVFVFASTSFCVFFTCLRCTCYCVSLFSVVSICAINCLERLVSKMTGYISSGT